MLMIKSVCHIAHCPKNTNCRQFNIKQLWANILDSYMKMCATQVDFAYKIPMYPLIYHEDVMIMCGRINDMHLFIIAHKGIITEIGSKNT